MSSLAARWLAAPVVAAVFLLGVWVTGGVITDDFRAAMALTASWVVLSGGACLVLALRRRVLRVPVLGAFGLTAAVVGGFLFWTTTRDRVVHERVVVGTPAHAVSSTAARDVQVRSGAFRSEEHASRGTAAVVRLRDGRRVLTLTRFSTSPGPDLRVRLVPGASADGGADGAIDLGALKGNRGDQQYQLPPRADLARYGSVVIWCRAFSAAFASARLRTT
jgi:hypothetical protein